MKFWRLLPALTIGLLLASCRTTPKVGKSDDGRLPHDVRPEDVAAVDAWKAKGGKGGFYPAPESLKTPLTAQNCGFVVDLDAQRAYFYQGSTLIAYTPIASGRKYFRTETGDFTIGQKDLNHRSTSYGSFVTSKGGTIMSDVENGYDPTPPGAKFEGAMMKHFQRLHYNGGPTAMGFHRGVLPGYPASHGCIRLPGTMAEWLYSNVPLGTPVAVRGHKNGIPYGKSQGRPKRAPKVHSSLKKPKEDPAVPPVPVPAPLPDTTTPEIGPGTTPSGDPTAPTPPPGN